MNNPNLTNESILYKDSMIVETSTGLAIKGNGSVNLTDNKNIENNLNEIYIRNNITKLTKAKITIENSVFSTYTYVHSDNRKLLYAKRGICGFTIYSKSDNKMVAYMSSNLFGTKYSINEKYLKSNYLNCNKNDKQYIDLNEDGLKFDVEYDVSFLKREKPRSFVVEYDKVTLKNKQPIFNPETNSYSLNFSGRVTTASVKNFQVIHPLDPTYITLTFGKESQEVFILDYTHPWSPLRAFCIGLTALDHKLGFE